MTTRPQPGTDQEPYWYPTADVFIGDGFDQPYESPDAEQQMDLQYVGALARRWRDAVSASDREAALAELSSALAAAARQMGTTQRGPRVSPNSSTSADGRPALTPLH